MKIFYISTERGWHGGEEQLRLLVEGARQQGHECRIAARAGGRFAERMRETGFPLVPLPGSTRGPRSLWRLRHALRSFLPDIIHANDPHGLTLARYASAWLFEKNRLLEKGQLLEKERAAKRKTPGCVASRRVLFALRSPKKYLAWCDRTVCVSHAIAQVCREGGIPPEMLRVVHSGIDPQRTATGDAARGRESLGVAARAPLVLCVGQLAEYKGHRYLLEAMATVVEQFPEAVLAMAGDGPLGEELQQLAKRLGIGRSVLFLGYRSDVPDLMRACDLFVLASPAEGLGTSVLDAMFAEKAVVGADAGGIPEMLGATGDQPAAGWLVPPQDSVALAAAIAEALGSAELRQQYAAAGKQRAFSGFTSEQMVHNMLAIYGELLAVPASR